MRLLLVALLLLFIGFVEPCANTKKQTFDCLLKYDSNGDKQIDDTEVLLMAKRKMTWYEKLIYPPTWIQDKFNKDCTMPLTSKNIEERHSCFVSCLYRDSIVGRICPH